MDYTELDVDQQKQILKSRIAGWEAEHFGHTLNLAAGEAVKDKATIDASGRALKILEASILAGRAELEKLGE